MGYLAINWSCVSICILNLVMSVMLDGLYTRNLFRSWGKLSEHGNSINGQAPCDLPAYLRNYEIHLIYMTSFFVLYSTIDLLKAVLLWPALSKRKFSEFWSALQVFNIFVLIAKGLFWSIHNEAHVPALAGGITAIIWSISLLGYVLHVNTPIIKPARSLKPLVFVSNKENAKNVQHMEGEHQHDRWRFPVCSTCPPQHADSVNCADVTENSVYYRGMIFKSVSGGTSRQVQNECIMMIKDVPQEVRLGIARRIFGTYIPAVFNENPSRRVSIPEETPEDNMKVKGTNLDSDNDLTKSMVEAATSEETAKDNGSSIETVTRQCEIVRESFSDAAASNEIWVTELNQSELETTAITDNDSQEKPPNAELL